jgi:hypothetical protein
MLPLYSFNFVWLVVCAIFFYRAGEFENCPGLLWAVMSVSISLLIWQWLRRGLMAMILGRIALFVGIVVFRAMRKA